MRQKLCTWIASVFIAVVVFSLPPLLSSDTPKGNPSSFLPLNPELYGIKQWRVGESSEYTLISYRENKKEVKRLRYAILGKQQLGRSPYFVVENQVTELDDARHTTINSVLRPFGDLTNLMDGATGDFITKQDTEPARAIPIYLIREKLLPFQTQTLVPQISSIESLDHEAINTPAGKFKTTHQKFFFDNGRAAEVWWTESLGPLGLVKVVSKDFLLTLLFHQAKKSASAISEIPKPVAP